MSSESRFSAHRVRSTISAVALSGALVASVGALASPSGANTVKFAAPSPFCKTLLSFSSMKGAPSTANLTTYRHWIAVYLPKFETLDSQAPNASVKRVLDEIVAVLKSESSLTSAVKLQHYIVKNQKQWTNDWKVFATSAMSCVSSMY